MTIKEIVEKTAKFFSDKEIASSRLEAELLLSEALGMKRLDLYLKYDQMLNSSEVDKCREMVRRRSQGEPVAYILQKKDFFHSTFFVDARVLIPRPETEELVEKALAWAKAYSGHEARSDANAQSGNRALSEPEDHTDVLATSGAKTEATPDPIRILDLGCGSGCIGLSLAKELPNATVDFVDSSVGALEVTRLNAEALELDARTQVHQIAVQDFDFAAGPWDLIVANPPYIAEEDARVEKNVKRFEPPSALFAHDAGLKEIKEWLKLSVSALSPNGFLIFEMGDLQRVSMEKWIADQAWPSGKFTFAQDLSGKDRFIIWTTSASEQ